MKLKFILFYLLLLATVLVKAETQPAEVTETQSIDSNGFQIMDGRVIGTEGLIVRTGQQKGYFSNSAINELVDLRQPGVRFSIPTGWTPVSRDNSQAFYFFRNSQGLTTRVLVLDRQGQTVMKAILPDDVANSIGKKNPFPLYFNASDKSLFAVSPRSIYQMTGRSFQWKQVFTLANNYDFDSYSSETAPGYPKANGKTSAQPSPTPTPEPSADQSQTVLPTISGFNSNLPVFTINNNLYFKIYDQAKFSYLLIRLDLSGGSLQNIYQATSVANYGFETGADKWHLVSDRYLLFKCSQRLMVLDLENKITKVIDEISYLYNSDELYFLTLPKQRVVFTQTRTGSIFTIDLNQGLNQIKSRNFYGTNSYVTLSPMDDRHVLLINALDDDSSSNNATAQNKDVPTANNQTSYYLSEVLNIETGGRFWFPQLLQKLNLKQFSFTRQNQLYFNWMATKNSPMKMARIDFQDFFNSRENNSQASITPSLYSTQPGNNSGTSFLSALMGIPLPNQYESSSAFEETSIPYFIKNPKAFEFTLSLFVRSLNTFGITNSSRTWDRYKSLLIPALSAMSQQKKEFWIEDIAISLTDGLLQSGYIPSIPPSKIANTLIVALKKEVGIPIDDRIDFYINPITDYSGTSPYMLSNINLEFPASAYVQSSHYFGIYFYTLSDIKIQAGQTLPFSYYFKKNGEDWKVHGTATGINIAKGKPIGQSLPYDQFRKDGRLTGAFVIAKNLGEGFEKLAAKILRYYQSEGFIFGLPTVKWKENTQDWKEKIKESTLFTTNVKRNVPGKKWLETMISSGELDYLVKEGHSAGSDNVLEMSNLNNLIVGRKIGLNGITEVVYILYPEQADYNQGKLVSEFITSTELNTLLLEREKNHGAEFLFINSSCWSYDNAAKELAENTNNLLLEIATSDLSPTFTTKPDNAERNLVHYIRHGLSYKAMRFEMDKVKGTNNFLLPNEEKYKSMILDRIGKRVIFESHFSKVPPSELSPELVGPPEPTH